jgi:hypothetical protein
MRLEFSRQIFESYSNSKLMKIRSLGAELFHTDGQTDRWTDREDVTKLIVAFCNFAKALKNARSFIYFHNMAVIISVKNRALLTLEPIG